MPDSRHSFRSSRQCPSPFSGCAERTLLPILSFLIMLPLLAVVTARSNERRFLYVLSFITLFANPMFFYALEFWEHAPAVACLTATTALILAWPNSVHLTAAAGGFAGLAILLRPEAAWYVVALAWLLRPRAIALVTFSIGAALSLVPFAIANFVHSGNLAGPHVTTNLGPYWDDWLTAHVQRARLWLLPTSLMGLVALAAMASVWVSPLSRIDLRKRQTIALAAGALIALASARGAFAHELLWTAWPAGVLVLIPFTRTTNVRRYWWLALFSAGAVLLTSAHDGGTQWGPRFLLVAVPRRS